MKNNKNKKPVQIGPKIRRLRKARGWTQERLARKAGITIVYLSEIENNKAPQISLMVVVGLAKALGVPVSILVGDISLGRRKRIGRHRSCCI